MSRTNKVVRLLGPVALGMAGIVLLTGCGRFNGEDAPAPSPSTSESSTPTPTPTPSGDPISDELKELLDASTVSQDFCLDIVKAQLGEDVVVNGVYNLQISQTKIGPLPGNLKVEEGNPDALQWSDSLELMLKGSAPEELRNSVYLAICTKPYVGVSLRHLFANLTLADGTEVIDLQSTDWLKEGLVPESELNDQAMEYIPNLFEAATEDEDYEAAHTAFLEYNDMANMLVYLVSHYELGKVMPINSTHSYHVLGGGLSADQAPEIRITHSLDSRDAIVFYLTEKTECAPISILGFNLGDSRPMLTEEGYSCEQVTPPPPSTPPTCDCPPPPPPSDAKTGRTPGPGSGDGTDDDGTGTAPPAPAPADPPDDVPDPVNTQPPVVTNPTAPPSESDTSNGTVTD